MNRLLLIIIFFSLTSCAKQRIESGNVNLDDSPNIVLILSDDNGFETLGINGSTGYKTPQLDSIAIEGINYLNTKSTPICSSSRSKLLTGKLAVRDFEGGNYVGFAYLKNGERTIANALQDCGYYTGIVGKWQLSGAGGVHQSTNIDRAHDFGFNEYRLYNYLDSEGDGGGYDRYTSPDYRETGGIWDQQGDDKYGEDINTQWAKNFISENKNSPFFLYYPMVLPHSPYIMTPVNPNWETASNTEKFTSNSKLYYGEMIQYMDMIVGDIFNHLKSEEILDNTIFIYLSDNGTQISIENETTDGNVIGGKGRTLDAGIHVPMVIHYPNGGRGGSVCDKLISLADLFPTLTEASKCSKEEYDGISFVETFSDDVENSNQYEQDCIVEYYDAVPPSVESAYNQRTKYALTVQYKLYQDGRFYDYLIDPLELTDITGIETQTEISIKKKLEEILNTIPDVN